MSNRQLQRLKALIFATALLPLLITVWQVASGQSVDPVATMTHNSGYWALIFLLLTLSVSPARRLGAPGWLLRLRRMLGLYAFFYASLHFAIYLLLDQALDLSVIGHDIIKRPFITVGFAALLLMTPLALTSTDGWIRRLKRNWGRLHRLVYPVAMLAVVHYWWLVKRDHSQPLLFAVLLALLLLVRFSPKINLTKPS